MQEIFRAIGRLARSSMTVLINGESGTGKELVARALHRHSQRKQGPFVALNTAATYQSLEDRVAEGQFREDLFHRLNVIRLKLPALRERVEDIPQLMRFFLQAAVDELDVPVKSLSEQATEKLQAYS